MSADDASTWHPSDEDLLQFLYLMPVGVLQCDEEGRVGLVNAAAARLLAPALGGMDLADVHPVLASLCPELLAAVTDSRREPGPIGSTQRFLATTSVEHDLHVELCAVRVQVGLIMVVVLDRTLERQLMEHERAQLTDLDTAVVQDLVAAETALGMGDIDGARLHVERSADAGRAWLGRQLERLDREPVPTLALQAAPRSHELSAGPGTTVLIVDDSEQLRTILEILVTEDPPGWVVTGTAVNGKEAIEKAADLSPDLILLDVSMPVMDGLTALPHLRRSAPGATVIMVSAFPASQLRREAIDAGASGFIDKAHLVEELVPAIERILAGEPQDA